MGSCWKPDAARPHLLAPERDPRALGGTVAVLIEEGDQAVAVPILEFRRGDRPEEVRSESDDRSHEPIPLPRDRHERRRV